MQNSLPNSLSSIHGFRVVVSPSLATITNLVVVDGGELKVSQAIYEKMKSLSGDALQDYVKSLGVIDLGKIRKDFESCSFSRMYSPIEIGDQPVSPLYRYHRFF